MIDYDISFLRDYFSRLFVLAVDIKMNFDSFTKDLERSEFVRNIELDAITLFSSNSLLDIFSDITGHDVDSDTSYGVYNDAYWCGKQYFDLFLKTHKSFSYLFLKFPLEKMMDLYSTYHEMDFSSLVTLFEELEKEKTILRILCERYRISLNELSKETGINKNTLVKYNASDIALYKGSFQNIIQLCLFFDVPVSLFVR